MWPKGSSSCTCLTWKVSRTKLSKEADQTKGWPNKRQCVFFRCAVSKRNGRSDNPTKPRIQKKIQKNSKKLIVRATLGMKGCARYVLYVRTTTCSVPTCLPAAAPKCNPLVKELKAALFRPFRPSPSCLSVGHGYRLLPHCAIVNVVVPDSGKFDNQHVVGSFELHKPTLCVFTILPSKSLHCFLQGPRYTIDRDAK